MAELKKQIQECQQREQGYQRREEGYKKREEDYKKREAELRGKIKTLEEDIASVRTPLPLLRFLQAAHAGFITAQRYLGKEQGPDRQTRAGARAVQSPEHSALHAAQESGTDAG